MTTREEMAEDMVAAFEKAYDHVSTVRACIHTKEQLEAAGQPYAAAWNKLIKAITSNAELRERLAKQIEKLRNHHIETPCCGNSEWRGKLCLLHQGIAMVVDEVEALLKEFP